MCLLHYYKNACKYYCYAYMDSSLTGIKSWFCPWWVVLGSSAQNSAVPPCIQTEVDSFAWHLKSVKYETRKPLVMFFFT